jgi:HD-like signal output (HDOD) protein
MIFDFLAGVKNIGYYSSSSYFGKMSQLVYEFGASGWKLPRDICKVILNHHEEDFLSTNQDHMENLVFATLRIADNMVSSLKRRKNVQGWDDIKEACYLQLGMEEHKYQDLCEDLEELWQQRE